jgi:hypothetical protein
MPGTEETQKPQPTRRYSVGYTVHVYHGTSAGNRAHEAVAYIGTVVGFHQEQKKWLVCDVHCLILSVLFCPFLFCLCLSNLLSFCNKVRNIS